MEKEFLSEWPPPPSLSSPSLSSSSPSLSSSSPPPPFLPSFSSLPSSSSPHTFSSPLYSHPLDLEPKRKASKKEISPDFITCEEMKLINKDYNMEVSSLLAQWWKLKQRHLNIDRALDHTHSPNTKLYHILKLPSAQEFLKLRINFLVEKEKEESKESEKGKIKSVLALCHYLLGNVTEAMNLIQQTINDECDIDEEIEWKYHLISKQYTVLLRQQEAMKTPITKGFFPQSGKVERRDCSKFSFEDFFYNFAMKGRPVIITGLKMTTSSQPWTLQYIKNVIGHKSAPLKHAVPDSVEWAKLEPCGNMNIGQFIDSLKKQDKGGSSLKYLFDWSIPLHCPELAQELIIPKYFSSDILQLTPSGSLYQDSWPSLFIAPPGITSSLHVDAFGSNFWMALFEGKKRWVFYPPEDLPYLYPQYYIHSTDPVFPSLKEEEHPLLAMTHPVECILEEGDVLFVPAGSPHQVDNLEASLAISTNFVDLSNIQLVQRELKINSLVDPRAKDLLSSINELSLTVDLCQKDLLWSEFKQSKI